MSDSGDINQSLKQEIAERRRAEELLRESEENLRFILDATRVGTWDLDIATGKASWSEILESIHGLAPGTFGGTLRDFLSIIHEEDRQQVETSIKKAISEGKDFHIEYRVPTEQGASWLEVKGHILHGHSGKPLRMAGICMDVTARKQADARFRLAVEASPSAVVLVNSSGSIILANSRAEEIFGYSAGELVGQSVETLVPQKHREDHKHYRAGFTRSPETRRMGTGRELFGLRKDGSQVPVEIGLNPIQTPEGLVTLATILDITNRKKAEAERLQLLEAERAARSDAERANRLKDMFLANLSHELRTPLNAVLGWSQLLSHLPLEGEAAQAVSIIERNARMQARLIEDLLDMSRIISGKIRLEMQLVDIPLVLNAAIESVLPAAQAKKIEITKHIDPNIGQVHADSNRLQQILWNLLSNAIKFTPKGGKVEVDLRRVLSQAEICVSDNGQGIKPEFLPHLFDRFRQEDPSLTRTYTGLGLGLSIVKHLVELHGGCIRGESDGEGLGSRFTFTLPLAPLVSTDDTADFPKRHSQDIPANLENDGHSLQDVRVLVVDDDTDGCTLAGRVLQDCGATVATANSAAEGLQLYEPFRPDIIVSDISMPGQDGYQFIQQIRRMETSTGKYTPATALTAFARPEDRVRSLRAGFQAHISKPLVAGELVAVVASLTGRITGKVKTYQPTVSSTRTCRQIPMTAKAESNEPTDSASTQSARILVVEDSHDVGTLICEFLRMNEYQADLAPTCAEAMALHELQTYDLIISDLNLPDGSGLELMSRLNQHRPISGIALSGHEGRAFADACRQAGFSEFLVKPAEEHDLLTAIERILQKQSVDNKAHA